MTLAELAAATGVPERTIRFYISRGLLDGPEKAGRGAAYSREHLNRLAEIAKLQAAGRTLSEIARAGGESGREPAPVEWLQFSIAGDVSIWVRAGASPWRMKKIRVAIGDLAARLADDSDKGEQQ